MNPVVINGNHDNVEPSFWNVETAAELGGTRSGGGYDSSTDGYTGPPTYNPDVHPGMLIASPGLRYFVEMGEGSITGNAGSNT